MVGSRGKFPAIRVGLGTENGEVESEQQAVAGVVFPRSQAFLVRSEEGFIFLHHFIERPHHLEIAFQVISRGQVGTAQPAQEVDEHVEVVRRVAIGVAKGEIQGDHAVIVVVEVVVLDAGRVFVLVHAQQLVTVEDEALGAAGHFFIFVEQVGKQMADIIGLQFEKLQQHGFRRVVFAVPEAARPAVLQAAIVYGGEVLGAQIPVFLKAALRLPVVQTGFSTRAVQEAAVFAEIVLDALELHGGSFGAKEGKKNECEKLFVLELVILEPNMVSC